MTHAASKHLVAVNASIWANATLASVILPFITDSVTDGRSGFLRIMAHAAPLLVGMYISSLSVARAARQPAS